MPDPTEQPTPEQLRDALEAESGMTAERRAEIEAKLRADLDDLTKQKFRLAQEIMSKPDPTPAEQKRARLDVLEEFVRECAVGPDPQSDHGSLLRWVTERARAICEVPPMPLGQPFTPAEQEIAQFADAEAEAAKWCLACAGKPRDPKDDTICPQCDYIATALLKRDREHATALAEQRERGEEVRALECTRVAKILRVAQGADPIIEVRERCGTMAQALEERAAAIRRGDA